MPERVTLVSGGLDSLLVWSQRQDTVPVFARLGQPYELAESMALHRIAAALPDAMRGRFALRPLRRLNLMGLTTATGFVPLRNLLLAAAVAAEGASEILLGSTKADVHADNRPEFRGALSAMLSDLLARPVRVEAPLWSYSKSEAINVVLACNPALAPAILSTRSCYALAPRHINGTTVGCGRCRACLRRREAWREANFPEDRYDDD